MKEAGVHTDYVTVIPGAHTGHAIIQRDKEGDNCILLYGGTNQLITKEQADSVLSHFQPGTTSSCRTRSTSFLIL